MAHTYNQKMMAQIDGDFVVFLIGVRITQPAGTSGDPAAV